MWKIFWCSAAAIGSVVLFVAWTGATATFLYKHPTNRDVRVVIDRRTGGAVVEAIAFPERAAPAPRAVVPQREHDFGRMDPHSSGTHTFEIRNAGAAPLELRLGETSCKCTLSGLDINVLAPGETARVKLDWNTGRTPLPTFTQSATVLTNDPLSKRIELVVTGRVNTEAALDSERIVLPAIEPDQKGFFETLIYSQRWQQIAVEGVEGNLPDLEWEVEDVPNTSVSALDATAVRRLRVRFSRPVEKGAFEEELRIRVAPHAGDERAINLYLPVQGSAIRRLAIYGPAIDDRGIIDLGVVERGTSHSAALLVKVRDPQPELPDPKITVTPDFLEVRLSPADSSAAPGLYRLEVRVPEDAPVGQYRISPLGIIRIDSGHPRIGEVELSVSFAVMPRQRL